MIVKSQDIEGGSKVGKGAGVPMARVKVLMASSTKKQAISYLLFAIETRF